MTFFWYAIEHDVMLKDPYKEIVCKVDDQMLRKDVLSLEEIQVLINCHYKNENLMVRRAFIFCLYCGLRFCDVYDRVGFTNRTTFYRIFKQYTGLSPLEFQKNHESDKK